MAIYANAESMKQAKKAAEYCAENVSNLGVSVVPMSMYGQTIGYRISFAYELTVEQMEELRAAAGIGS